MGRERGYHTPAKAGRVTAEDVSAYLREHPDFFVRQPELLAHISAPRADSAANVLDFQHFMIERLRADLADMRREQRELVSSSRAQINNQSRIHAAVLFLLDAPDLHHLFQTITTELAVLLDLDVVCLVLEGETDDCPTIDVGAVRVVRPGTVEIWLDGCDIILEDGITGDPDLFGPGAGLVRSQALVRLEFSSRAPRGLLALGSREPDGYHPGQSTELLSFLARVAERCLRQALNLPR